MKKYLYNFIVSIILVFTRYRFLVSFSLLISAYSFSQRKLTDSLLFEKQKFEKLSDAFSKDTNYIKLLYKLGRSYIYQIPDSTKIISDRIIQLSEPLQFTPGIVGAKINLATINFLNGDFSKGNENIKNAVELSQKLELDSLHLDALNTKALGEFMLGDYPNAYKTCTRGERLANHLGIQEVQLNFLINLATCFTTLNDYEQAIPYLKKAKIIALSLENELIGAKINSNLGYAYLHLGEYEKAKRICKNAIAIFSKKEFQAWHAFTCNTLGNVALKEHHYNTALNFFTKGELLLSTIEDKQRMADNFQGFADTYFLISDFNQSLKFAKKAEIISRNISYHYGIVQSSKLLYRLLVKNNQPKEALDYLHVAQKLSDSIFESENRTKFLLLDTKAKFDRSQTLNEFENDKKLSEQKTITYVTLILLTALLIISLIVRKSAQDQKKANRSLKELNDTKDQLFSIIGHDLKAPIGTLQGLLALYTSKEISKRDVVALRPSLKQNVDRSAFLLNNLLYWAKTQMITVIPDKKVISGESKIKSICDSFDIDIKEKNLSTEYHIESDLVFMMDVTHFEIAVRNLISNAIKYSHKDGVLKFTLKGVRENKVSLSIWHAGVGIQPSIINTIFKNESVDCTPGAVNEKSAGIGLQITKELIKLNGGELEMRSKNDKGTYMTITLITPK
ncbi:MAG: ATP-binding protein [Croceivirga sp.]